MYIDFFLISGIRYFQALNKFGSNTQFYFANCFFQWYKKITEAKTITDTNCNDEILIFYKWGGGISV